MNGETIVAVIPARFASTRYPGKLLESLHGRPVLEHVWRRARRVRGLDRLLVATDDDRIATLVRSFGGEVALTSSSHRSGTDRIGEVVRRLDRAPSFVLNLQGDEPCFPVRAVENLLEELQNRPDAIWTLAHPIADAEFCRPSVVKVALAADGRALYFSRAPIPYARMPEATLGTTEASAAPRLRHLGIYGYPRDLLERFLAAEESPLERVEGLEQLRALELGLPIRVLVTEAGSPGIDTPEDLERLCTMYPSLGALEAAGE